jgi:hypothetical protein
MTNETGGSLYLFYELNLYILSEILIVVIFS